jgi:SAM-dependent methyltransferase
MIYQHPLAYLMGMEGLALLRAWAGDSDYDMEFVRARLLESRQLLENETLTTHPGVLVERDATGPAYAEWSTSYDDPGNDLFDLDEPLLDLILDTLPAGIAVDAACGTGRLTSRLVQRGYRVVGVDSSLEMLQQARGRLPDTDLVVGDLHRLPLPEDCADLVVTGLALTHVADLRPVFAETARVLRPGGHLIISDVHHDLTFLGSVVKALGPAGQPQMATIHRHTTADFLRASLATGFLLLGYDEQPRPSTPGGPVPEPTNEIGGWQDWPWTPLDSFPRQAAPPGASPRWPSGTSSSRPTRRVNSCCA